MTTDHADREGIGEGDLIDFAKHQAIKEVRITPLSTGGYGLVLKVNWRKGELQVVASRTKQPRKWSSLDRLINLLTDLLGDINVAPLVVTPASATPSQQPEISK